MRLTTKSLQDIRRSLVKSAEVRRRRRRKKRRGGEDYKEDMGGLGWVW